MKSASGLQELDCRNVSLSSEVQTSSDCLLSQSCGSTTKTLIYLQTKTDSFFMNSNKLRGKMAWGYERLNLTLEPNKLCWNFQTCLTVLNISYSLWFGLKYLIFVSFILLLSLIKLLYVQFPHFYFYKWNFQKIDSFQWCEHFSMWQKLFSFFETFYFGL